MFGHRYSLCSSSFVKLERAGWERTRSFGPSTSSKRPRPKSPCMKCTSTVTSDDNSDTSENMSVHSSNFMSLSVSFGDNFNVSALLDSGSNINLISEKLYQLLPLEYKSEIDENGCDIILANDQKVCVLGTAIISAITVHGTHVIVECSNPLLLGIPYLQSHNMILNFGSNTISVPSKQIKCSYTTRFRTIDLW